MCSVQRSLRQQTSGISPISGTLGKKGGIVPLYGLVPPSVRSRYVHIPRGSSQGSVVDEA